MTEPSDTRELYLSLLKRVLTRYEMGHDRYPVQPDSSLVGRCAAPVQRLLAKYSLELVRVAPFDAQLRANGVDHPAEAETMIGLRRLDNIQHAVETVLRDGTPGDLLEAGVWRGGAAIFMRAVLKAHGVRDRVVWAADSFNGLPPPKPENPADRDDKHYLNRFLAVSVDEVRRNFERFQLLDDYVSFLEGWFEDTLRTAPIENLAVLRLDGDMYGSTMDVLNSLYAKVSPGGFVIIDDYGAIPGCRKAVNDFRGQEDITEPIQEVDWTSVYWQRSASGGR